MRFDPTSFTSARDRVRLLLWASQNELNPKRGEIKSFRAIALTNAVALSPTDLSNYGRKTGTTSQAVIGRYILRVRIKDDLYTTNPHQYLPNPCALESTDNIGKAIRLIKMHTLCLTSADFRIASQSPIRRNDIVEITLNMNRESNTIETSQGIITKVIKRAVPGMPVAGECVDLTGKFEISTITLLDSYAPAPDTAPVGDTGEDDTQDTDDTDDTGDTDPQDTDDTNAENRFTGMTEEQIIAALVAEHIALWDEEPDTGEMMEIEREARLRARANP